MPSVLQFFSDALVDVGACDPGQTPSSNRIQHARRKYADMIRNWSTKRLRLFYIPESEYALQNGVGSYQIGPGAAQFDTTPGVYVKPVFIQAASVVIGVNRRWPLNILTRPQWDLNQNKTIVDPDGPLDLFYDFGNPIATINVGPIPNTAQRLLVSQWNPLRIFAEGEEALNVEDFYPQEYLKPMQTGLSIELAPSYGFSVGQEMAALYSEGVMNIERMNNDKLSGSFGASRTLDGPTKGDGSPVGQAGQQQ